MILDKELMFSEAQALTTTGYSTNVVQLGRGVPGGLTLLALHVIVRSESGTSPTLTAELETSEDNVTYTKVLGLKKPESVRAFGAKLGGIDLHQYLRIRYAVGGAGSAYNVTAMLVMGEEF